MYYLPEQPDLNVNATNPASDGKLWELFKSGDREAFARIYQTHIQALYSYGTKINTNSQVVEDCIQELFIYLWRTKENLGSTDNIKFYLFKALRRRICSEIEANTKLDKVSNNFAAEQPAAEASPENNLIIRQGQLLQQENMQQALLFLTKRQREAIYLKFYDNLSFPEIAGIMNLQLKSTYNLVEKAIIVLREHLQALVISLLAFLLFSA